MEYLLALIMILSLILLYLKWKFNTTQIEKIILFYRPNCPWCELFKPEWYIIESELGERAQKIDISNKDSEIQTLIKEFEITSVPTLFLIDIEGKKEKYTGKRTAIDILNRIK